MRRRHWLRAGPCRPVIGLRRRIPLFISNYYFYLVKAIIYFLSRFSIARINAKLHLYGRAHYGRLTAGYSQGGWMGATTSLQERLKFVQ